MKTKREIAEEQIKIQEEMQNAGFNLVTCGKCGNFILHRVDESDTIDCFCGEIAKSDCPDYWYEGCQDSDEFNN